MPSSRPRVHCSTVLVCLSSRGSDAVTRKRRKLSRDISVSQIGSSCGRDTFELPYDPMNPVFSQALYPSGRSSLGRHH
ncbi:hypothetical protein NDU88_005617 [Pleurodeles waltl]|uniref:Secreted protein n=1 Tax=Pleurodeles waltl TaxID=8319 RepID=A0AAV7PHC5_PLEWA|nr:hypothetical protein NDU88_005617 [Pleurodeles waltl]